MSKKQDSPFDHAVVAIANHHQFDGKPRRNGACVRSRMLLWSKAGAGQVRVNRRRLVLHPGDFVLLPWGHDITYRPDPADPFLVGGVHVIPHHARNRPVEFFVPHNPNEPFCDCSYRRDLPAGVLPEWMTGSFDSHPALGHLAEYIVAWYQRRDLEEAVGRKLGSALLEELSYIHHQPSRENAKIPIRLKRMVEYIRSHLAEKITVEELAELGQCSASTVHRLFAKAFGASPMEWLIGWRIREAARLLSTTSLPVGEVGRRVGVEDPYYFSKLFRRHMSMTAGEYRKRNSLA